MIAVVDYRKGNLMSVERGLCFVGGDAFVTGSPEEIAKAQAIVLPGVGAFADAAASMTSLRQTPVIRDAIARGVPFLGICLGFQLLFAQGVEGAPPLEGEGAPPTVCGLGVIPGVVDRMPNEDAAGSRYKVPHVGWNTVELSDGGGPLFAQVDSGEYFYFTHSFIAPESRFTTARTTHSVTFPSAVQCGECAFGVQFHPEKSSDAGLRVLEAFVDIVRAAG